MNRESLIDLVFATPALSTRTTILELDNLTVIDVQSLPQKALDAIPAKQQSLPSGDEYRVIRSDGLQVVFWKEKDS